MGIDPFWSEEFDALDLVGPNNLSGRWRANDVWQPIDKGYNDFGAGGQSTYCVNPNERLADGQKHTPFVVANGVLTLTTTRNPGNLGVGAPWLGAFLVTNTARPDCSFGYGFYEFKARWREHGKGMFPALWFFAANGQDDSVNKGHAEIDLLEIFGHANGMPWNITLHEKDNNGNGQQKPLHEGWDDTGDFHTYAMEWSADTLRFYRDGQLVKDASGEAYWYRDLKMGIRLNYAMDANWFPADQRSDGSTPTTLHMDVEYVRAFRSKGERDGWTPPPAVIPPVTTAPPVTPTAPPTTAPVPPLAGNREVVRLPLVNATTGSDHILEAIQALLSVRGFPLTIDGRFGPLTVTAIKSFQQAKGLPVTGTVDAGTWARLLYA